MADAIEAQAAAFARYLRHKSEIFRDAAAPGAEKEDEEEEDGEEEDPYAGAWADEERDSGTGRSWSNSGSGGAGGGGGLQEAGGRGGRRRRKDQEQRQQREEEAEELGAFAALAARVGDEIVARDCVAAAVRELEALCDGLVDGLVRAEFGVNANAPADQELDE